MSTRVITLDELKLHNKPRDLWISVRGKVYDVSKFYDEHPGGDAIMDGAGKDATEIFLDVGHSDDAFDLLKKYYIGELKK